MSPLGDPHQTSDTNELPAREPMPTSFAPFWRFLASLVLLTVAIGAASALIGLALSD